MLHVKTEPQIKMYATYRLEAIKDKLYPSLTNYIGLLVHQRSAEFHGLLSQSHLEYR